MQLQSGLQFPPYVFGLYLVFIYLRFNKWHMFILEKVEDLQLCDEVNSIEQQRWLHFLFLHKPFLVVIYSRGIENECMRDTVNKNKTSELPMGNIFLVRSHNQAVTCALNIWIFSAQICIYQRGKGDWSLYSSLTAYQLWGYVVSWKGALIRRWLHKDR